MSCLAPVHTHTRTLSADSKWKNDEKQGLTKLGPCRALFAKTKTGSKIAAAIRATIQLSASQTFNVVTQATGLRQSAANYDNFIRLLLCAVCLHYYFAFFVVAGRVSKIQQCPSLADDELVELHLKKACRAGGSVCSLLPGPGALSRLAAKRALVRQK